MRRPKKRTVLILAALLLLACITVVWEVADWPPPRLILKYGFPPTGGPTGRTKVIHGIEFVELKPGYFRQGYDTPARNGDLLGRVCRPLGLPWGRHRVWGDEGPPFWAEVPVRLWVARTEVTNSQFDRDEPEPQKPVPYPPPNHPAVVDWIDATDWCRRLSLRNRGVGLRLPSETEWEFAARAGSTGDHGFDTESERLDDYVWHYDNSNHSLQPAGRKQANAWGLHDMQGNVLEWCGDEFGPLPTSPRPLREGYYAQRGGCIMTGGEGCRVTRRFSWKAGDARRFMGFRPVFTLPEDE